jgi:SWI/SNF-related matrix-associated actin-dependent regulator 1 of chromatin subfamily A
MVRYDGTNFVVDLKRKTDLDNIQRMDLKMDIDYTNIVVDQTVTIKPTKNRAEKLNALGFEFHHSAEKFLKSPKIKDENFNKLFPFQQEGVIRMLKQNGNILLADEQGLGKTPQASMFLRLKSESLPALIISPASLKYNWRKEVKKWCGVDSMILSGKTPEKILKSDLKKYPVCIINYDILGSENPEDKKREKRRKELCEKVGEKYKKKLPAVIGWVDELIAKGFKTLICDECQCLGELSTIRTRAVHKLAESLPECTKIMISGTPYETKTLQFFPILKVVNPEQFNNEWQFKFRYCDPVRNRFGWEFKGLSNGHELHEKISKFMIRRLKCNVLKDLPPKIRSVIPMEISKDGILRYQRVERELDELILKKEKNALSKIAELKQVAVEVKKESAIRFIKDYLEANDKVIVFIWHKKIYDFLMDEFRGIAVGIVGDTKAEMRAKAEEEFQNNPKIKLFVGNIESAGVGLTLTASSSVVFLEFGMTAPSMVQAEDRVHRIGQKSDSVLAQYLIFENSIESDVMSVFNDRFANLTEVLDDNKQTMFEVEEKLNKEILARYKKRKKLSISA